MSNTASNDTLSTEQVEEKDESLEESMEELKMLDEDEKEPEESDAVNVVDFLGEERLLMSDSENDSPQKNKRNVGVLEPKSHHLDHVEVADNENKRDVIQIENIEPAPIQVETKEVHSKPKKRMLIESADEETEMQTTAKNVATVSESKERMSDFEVETRNNNKVNEKDKADDDGLTEIQQKLKQKYSNIIDSDTEPENSDTEQRNDESNEEQHANSAMDININEKDKADDHGLIEVQRKVKQKYSNIIDSDTEPENSDTEQRNDESNEEEHANSAMDHETPKAASNKTKKPIRASAKKAIDEIQAIQSEQQRLHREAFISVPYHVPKKHTLKEFLNRRTIIKPKLQGEGSPAAAVVKTKRLKMNSEELAEYAKLMEERIKEATEFFKSESESENENDKSKDDDVIENDASQNKETNKEESKDPKIDDIDNFSKSKNNDDIAECAENNEIVESMKIDAIGEPLDKRAEKEITHLEQDVLLLTTQPIITEIVELPNLDISTIQITPERNAKKAQFQSHKSESIKRLINECKLSKSRPSLHGNPDMLIDLDSGDLVKKTPIGVDNLLQRLMSTKARKRKTAETVSILSTENGKLELSKVNVHTTEETDPNADHKPGAAFFKLKNNLKSIIKQKRLEELHKKQEDEKEHLKCLEDDDEDELDEYDLDEKPKSIACNELEDDYNVDDNEYVDNEEEMIDSNSEHSYDVKLKNMDDKIEEEEQESSDSDIGNDNEQLEPNDHNILRKNRIIAAFQDDSDDEVDLLKTQKGNDFNKPAPLFDTETQKSPFDNVQEFCSEKYNETQKPPGDTAIISQIPITQQTSMQDHTEELLDLCSGNFETQTVNETVEKAQCYLNKPDVLSSPVPIALNTNKIISSDEENDTTENASSQRPKKLRKRMKKHKVKLGFSDDEDDNENSDSTTDNEGDVKNVAEEEPETYIDYDSEENEILVQLTKKDFAKEANKFLEKEAELSESDWGSADEDEKNIDSYDIELGDEDEFDRDKLRNELGQIHARKMLDDDIREVRKFTEMFIAEEDEDGVQRQRQFKWKNAESGFSLDDENRKENDVNVHDSADEENEQLWRKIRFEREQLLQQNQKDDPSSTMSCISLQRTLTGSNRKLNIITARKVNTVKHVKNSSPFLIAKELSTPAATVTPPVAKNVRGSFLVRDKATLDKLASMTKSTSAALSAIGGVAPTSDGTAGTVSVKTLKPKNFVFATLTEEEHENLKRKADDLMNSSSENGINYMKKPKVEPRRATCLIDKLL